MYLRYNANRFEVRKSGPYLNIICENMVINRALEFTYSNSASCKQDVPYILQHHPKNGADLEFTQQINNRAWISEQKWQGTQT